MLHIPAIDPSRQSTMLDPALDLRLTCQSPIHFNCPSRPVVAELSAHLHGSNPPSVSGGYRRQAAHRVLWNGGSRSWSCDMASLSSGCSANATGAGAAQLHQRRLEGSLRARQCLAAGRQAMSASLAPTAVRSRPGVIDCSCRSFCM